MLELVCWVFVKHLIVAGAAAMTMWRIIDDPRCLNILLASHGLTAASDATMVLLTTVDDEARTPR